MRTLLRRSRARWGAAAPWRRLAVVLWAVLLVGSCVRCLRTPGIYSVYAAAGRHWLAGEGLYREQDGWDSFLYSPLVAALLAPYGALPGWLGNVVWRLTLGGAYLAGLAWWGRVGLPAALSRKQTALLFLLVLPVTAATLLEGQAGGLVAALLLLTMAAAAEDRWNWAAGFAALACLLKLYPVAVVLLLAVAYPRRAAARMAAALIAGLLLPFLLQKPGYVADQYAGWLRVLRSSDRQSWSLDIANRDVALLFRVWLAPLPLRVWQATQLLAAGGAALLCLACRRAGWPRERVLATVLGLAGCWMTLFGPVVESFTYILIGPTLAWMLLEAWRERRPAVYRGVLLASWLIFTSAAVAPWFIRSIEYHKRGPHPAAGLLLLGCLLADTASRLRRPAPAEGVATARAA